MKDIQSGPEIHQKILHFALILALVFPAAGCNRDKELYRVNQEQAATINALNEEIARLNQELDELMSSREDLARAKSELEGQLQSEMASGNVAVSMQSRGLVVTVLDRVLFDSGKAELREEAKASLDKVVEILSDKVADNKIYVEGHTDNVPITYSKWSSNWELSTARATQVVHYFVDDRGVNPQRIAAVGYGEFQPVAENDTAEGRSKNRRVEIVVSPQKIMG